MFVSRVSVAACAHGNSQIGFPGVSTELEGLRNRRYGRTCLALYAAKAAGDGGPPQALPYQGNPEEFEPQNQTRPKCRQQQQTKQQQQQAE